MTEANTRTETVWADEEGVTVEFKKTKTDGVAITIEDDQETKITVIIANYRWDRILKTIQN